jgi:hypothetical protein
MSNLESRLTKLEAVQNPPHREWTDMELAVRMAYCIETGGAMAEKLLALLADSQEPDRAES